MCLTKSKHFFSKLATRIFFAAFSLEILVENVELCNKVSRLH